MNKTLAVIALSESKKTKVFKEDFEDQTYPQKIFSAIRMLHGQVLNGGFEQYFFNYSGCTIAFVVEALEAIRAIELANSRTIDGCWCGIKSVYDLVSVF